MSYKTPKLDHMPKPLFAGQELEYVGFWPRVCAALIDMAILLTICIPASLLVYGQAYFWSASFIMGPADILINWIFPLVFTVALWMLFAATPGKMALGAKVVDERTGAKPTFGQWMARYVGYFVSMIPLFAGIIWIATDSKRQGWHDKLAGTVVVRPKNHLRTPHFGQ